MSGCGADGRAKEGPWKGSGCQEKGLGDQAGFRSLLCPGGGEEPLQACRLKCLGQGLASRAFKMACFMCCCFMCLQLFLAWRRRLPSEAVGLLIGVALASSRVTLPLHRVARGGRKEGPGHESPPWSEGGPLLPAWRGVECQQWWWEQRQSPPPPSKAPAWAG